MNNIISQDFWCVTLDKDNRECIWKHDDDEISHHLMIEQVVLGLNCKERCMIEATSRLTTGEERSTMICQLIPSAVPNCKLSLSFKQQVKLRLAAGDGPVYLTGTHSQEIEEDMESDDEEGVPQLVDNEAEEAESSEEEDDEEGDEEIDEDKMLEELAAAQANKLKNFMKKDKKAIIASKPGPASKKRAKVAGCCSEGVCLETKPAVPAPVTEPAPPVTEPAPVDEEMKEDEGPVESAEKKEEPMEEISTPGVQEEEESDDEEESDEEDDDDEEEDDDEEDDDDEEVESDEDDDDDDEEEEEDDDEDDDEEESEEESEEEEAAPVSKKRKTEAPAPVPVKNGAAATPKAKKPQTPAKPSLNELKKKLLASPSLPKKYEKFVNLMKNAHKVTDEKEIKTTWEFLQKNKK